jgi:exonuclease SbcC
MRPRELTLHGFRSYRDRVTFDLRDRHLIGIVGPIGAGKSTILDAIAFALYGKTPAFERDTRSLINQLTDGCHVELIFEVDGQIWRAQRALRRKGQSQHRLERLAKDADDAEVLESVLQERPMRQRVERLLGMGFDAFCRSVLLAQNRFAEFLKATPTDRNAVLKGVFGYERFDAALAAAKDRVRAAELELDVLAREGARLAEARDRLTEARAGAAAAAERLAALDAARERLDRLTAACDAATRLVDDATARIDQLQAIATRLPPAEQLDLVSDAASVAADAVRTAEEAVVASDDARATAEIELEAIEERSGGRSAFEAFADLVATHDHEAKAVEGAIAAVRAAVAEATAARTAAEELATKAEASGAAREAANAALEDASAARGDAEVALHAAQHAEMAFELRRELKPGEPCPVCAQVVERRPRAGAAPKVAAADRALKKARSAEDRARAGRDVAANRAAAAVEQAAAGARRAEELAVALGVAEEAERTAEAALAVTKSELVDRLGDGDPRALLEQRRRELDAAEGRVRAASAFADAARTRMDAVRKEADEANARLGAFANELASAWGQLGEPRPVGTGVDDVRGAYVELGTALVDRLAEATEGRDRASAEAHAATEARAAELQAFDLPADADVTRVVADAAAAAAASATTLHALEETLTAGADLEARLLAAAGARDVARRLASDLQPSRFLAFLLEEERAALADLGSVHLEELTDGAYRFSEDDAFHVLDMNAGASDRTAESLSGGETFLASLALALALAEMVARGGGRLDSFLLDEGFGSLDAEHLDRAMDGIGRLVAGDADRLVVVVSHVEQMRQMLEDLIVLDKDARTGTTAVLAGASPA